MRPVEAEEIDCLVAIGGGSTIGLAKAIALRTDLPQIAIPTTYAGSEMTPIIGETSNGAKITQTTAKVLPEVVIYDVDLTMGLPVGLSGMSGINAIAHAVEALYARDRNPVISLMAAEGVRATVRALPAIALRVKQSRSRLRITSAAWIIADLDLIFSCHSRATRSNVCLPAWRFASICSFRMMPGSRPSLSSADASSRLIRASESETFG